jgi:hypothetical protein
MYNSPLENVLAVDADVVPTEAAHGDDAHGEGAPLTHAKLGLIELLVFVGFLGLIVKSVVPRVVYSLYSKVVNKLLAAGSTPKTVATAKAPTIFPKVKISFLINKRIASPKATATNRNAK